ncbi:MAG: Fic family protein, partial [Blautia sp.]|nr:Fic family protein [Blautia sp.]
MMDKERWMDIFQANYMSGRDVMNRLPLNVDAEIFWKELLDRRKSNAVMVPLYSPRSHAYWYVLTDKIVQASEILCKASLSWRQEDFAMTKQMTEEMYFTSFVEGVRLPFTEGVDFLVDKREPEDVEEQMLLNNREAWVALIGNICYPLDKKMVMGLAGMLTEGMAGAVEGYRTADGHRIVCMGSEDYQVPKAFQIPDRMEELYSFFANPHYHPLIKAAASHAFILAARPFQEGNERLARMVSAALLYQNGYGFFKDVSLSKVIAAEVPMYYNAMKETIREVNGG